MCTYLNIKFLLKSLYDANTFDKSGPIFIDTLLLFLDKSNPNVIIVIMYTKSLKSRLVGWLEFSIPCQHKYGYIKDERSGLDSYPYPVKDG